MSEKRKVDSKELDDPSKRYKKKTQREHILLRPDSYVGGIDKIEREEYVPPYDKEKNELMYDISSYSQFDKRVVKYCPAALKIVDEIFVNSRDASVRDIGVTQMRITLNKETGEISVWNNCTDGIPIVKHQEHDTYIPSMIFGELLTGENFQDNQAKVTGGRNGFGSKLTNIYSVRFEIDCTDTRSQKRFRQLFTDNMSVKTDPKITPYSQKNAYVQVTFLPDYPRLGGMKGMEDDFYALIVRRAFDISACTDDRVKIFLNGKIIKIRGMEKYIDYFLGPSKDVKRVFGSLDNTITPVKLKKLCDEFEQTQRDKGEKVVKLKFEDVKPAEMIWKVGVALSNDGFKQTSYVNGIHTSQGGTHVEYVTKKIINKIKAMLTAKKKDVPYNYIKENLWVFVDATVINPQFGGQTKSELTSKTTQFFYTCDVPDSFVEEFDRKCKILSRVMRLADFKDTLDLAKETDGKKQRKIRDLPKLEDANWAGTDKSHLCTLIVTEGDSAKTMAMSGRSILGNDQYGIFPLRGKIVNPYGMSDSKLSQNDEYKNLKKIIGLQENVDYTKDSNFKTLRYGRVLVMSDQDLDGFHIRALKPNLDFRRFPTLLQREGFQGFFITPIVVAKKGNEKKRFFNLSEADSWKSTLTPAQLSKWDVQYLKGLGTTERKDAIEYFKDFDNHNKSYINDNDEVTREALDLAFKSTPDYRAKRKEWLSNYDPKDILDYSKPSFTYHEMVHKELKHFSAADNVRSIANMLDGLKPAHRKILWALRLRGGQKKAKVSQLAGYISEKSDYHHGEAGLAPSIIGMAQNFVGSNNINLLTPSGQFGSRVASGNDASQPRYLFSKTEDVVSKLFHPDDDPLLIYNVSDSNKPIEPENYVPIVPTVLVNGCVGIGTGYSTEIPMYNPLDIISQLEKLIADSFTYKTLNEALEHANDVSLDCLVPWFRGFRGTVSVLPESDSTYKTFKVSGVWERLNDTQIRITELPVGKGTPNYNAYKEFLEKSQLDNKPKTTKKKDSDARLTSSKRKASPKKDEDVYFIKDYVSNTNDIWCDYVVTFPSKKVLDTMIRNNEVESKMKLESKILTSNMHLFDENNTIKKYTSTEHIIKSFYKIRLDLYYKRKDYLLIQLQQELDVLSAKARFLEMIITKKLNVINMKKAEIIQQLDQHEFPKFSFGGTRKTNSNIENSEALVESAQDDKKDYQYLLRIPIVGLSQEEVSKYQSERDGKMQELTILKNTDPKTLWKNDLKELKDTILTQNRELERSLELEASQAKKVQPKTKKVVKK